MARQVAAFRTELNFPETHGSTESKEKTRRLAQEQMKQNGEGNKSTGNIPQMNNSERC